MAKETSKHKLAIGNRQSEISFGFAYEQLLSYCRAHDFAGHDPFDALNSKLFQATPLASSRSARFIWTQVVKRSPSDLRSVSLVPPQRNSKGIALFALALLANHRRVKTAASETEARALLQDLISMRLDGYSGAAWGYNFDWQSRNFFAPKGTATIVPTAFAARALIEAARVFGDENYLSIARSVCDFILQDLPRPVSTNEEICFSYSPKSNTQIFNASLLAAEVLAEVGALTQEPELMAHAEKSARYVVKHQRKDGAWVYGTEPAQGWIDNFHTAFVLYSLKRVIERCSLPAEFQSSLERGYEYWQQTFFLADGWPKYYDDEPYPADTHAAASAIVTFCELAGFDPESIKSAENVARWAITNLRDASGYFYYQKRRFYTVKKPYMRWSQAWMLYGLGRLLEMSDML